MSRLLALFSSQRLLLDHQRAQHISLWSTSHPWQESQWQSLGSHYSPGVWLDTCGTPGVLSTATSVNHFRAMHFKFSLGSLEAPAWKVTISSSNYQMLCLHFHILCFCPQTHSPGSLLLQLYSIIFTPNSAIIIWFSYTKKTHYCQESFPEFISNYKNM